MRKIAGAGLACAVAVWATATGAGAAELVMFEDPGCSWCRRWHAEIGPSYPRSAEGRRAPLRRVHIRDQQTAGVMLAGAIRATPTFVLAESGREIGRIVGYPGEDFFYPRLGELLQRLPSPPPELRAPAERAAAMPRPPTCSPQAMLRDAMPRVRPSI
jgi:hypothetical protein